MITTDVQDEPVHVEPMELDAAAPLRAVERVEIVRRGDHLSLHATKVIDASDHYLPAHFPGFTIFPGVFIIEAVWQAVMIGVRESIGLRPAVEKVVSVRFLAPLFPRDSVTLDVSVGPMSAPGPLDAAAVCRRHDGTVVARVKLQLRRGGADGA